MRVAPRVVFVLAAGFAASAAVAQVPTPPKITDKVPDNLTAPTPTPAPRGPTEYVPRGSREAPPGRPTPGPTRTQTPTPVPPLVRHLDVRSGEVVTKKQSSPSACTTRVDSSSPGQTFVQIRCPLLPPSGLKADFEFWKGVRLKNGWKVDSLKADWSGSSNPQPPDNNHTGFRVSTAPVVGSDNPETTLHLFATAGLTIDVEVVLRVKGPPGTSPR
ncbi:MAG: hypothetical protein NEA02_17980 [Thermoanaerobaculia bacterium]|nr:hypothetical protein [Thermoanaerobaculia bacterium]